MERSVLATDVRKLPVDRLQLAAYREVGQERDGPEDGGEDEDPGEPGRQRAEMIRHADVAETVGYAGDRKGDGKEGSEMQ